TGKRSSAETAKYVAQHWSPLDGLTPAMLTQAKVNAIVDAWPVKTTTKNVRLKYLRAALNRALEDGYATEIPKLDLNELKAVKPIPTLLTASELTRLLAKAPTPRHRALLALAALAGLRRGEIVHQTLDTADPFGRRIYVKAVANFSPKTWEERSIKMHAT